MPLKKGVSIPDGLPRPFSLLCLKSSTTGQKKQVFARGSFWGGFLSLKKGDMCGLLQREEPARGVREAMLSITGAAPLAVELISQTATPRTVVAHLQFPHAPRSSHTVDRTAHCPASPSGALPAWTLTAPIASWSGNIRTASTGSTCQSPPGCDGFSCACDHLVCRRQ